MKKKITQDIVSTKKSIRAVEAPSRSKEELKKVSKYTTKYDAFTRPVSIHIEEESRNEVEDKPLRIPPAHENVEMEDVVPKHHTHATRNKKSGKKIMFAVVLGVIFFIGLVYSLKFNTATITISPVIQTKNLNDVFTAKKDNSGSSLNFQVVTVSKDIENPVDPKNVSSEKKVERKAKGSIVIYNNSLNVQKLIASTRVQTPEGLVFRLLSPVVVPSKSTKNGKSIPGSVETVIIADKPGPSYNLGFKDFTLPGLKTDPIKYKLVYARSKSEMTGGYLGVEKVILSSVVSGIQSSMQDSLRASLTKDIVSQIPSDFVLYQNSLNFKFNPIETINTPGGTTVAKVRGNVNAIIFDKKLLTKAILSKLVPDSNFDLTEITNLDSLSFNYQVSSSSLSSVSTITFGLAGDVNMVGVIDEDKLKSDLLGLSKSNANTVMTAYSSIKEAWILTKPFWNTRIPNDPKRVTIVNTYKKLQ